MSKTSVFRIPVNNATGHLCRYPGQDVDSAGSQLLLHHQLLLPLHVERLHGSQAVLHSRGVCYQFLAWRGGAAVCVTRR